MSLSVTFNGQRLVRPGAYSKVVSKLLSTSITGTSNLALVGTSEAGPLGLSEFTDSEVMKATYRSGDLADAAGVVFSASNDPRVTGGPSKVFGYRVYNSLTPPARATLAVKNGSGATLFTLTARDYGEHTNRLTASFSATTNILTVNFNDSVGSYSESSPATTGVKFTLAYSGSCTYSINDTAFSTSSGADDITLTFAGYSTVGDLVAALNAYTDGGGSHPYTATLIGNPTFATADLDQASSVSLTGTVDITGISQDVANWVNANSQLVSAAAGTATVTGSPATFSTAAFSGGSAGSAPVQSDWDAAFTALKNQRVNALVPLLDADAGAVVYNSMLATALTYANAMNSTSGRNEVQIYAGCAGNLATVKSTASTLLNTPHVCLYFDKHVLIGADGNLKTFPTWSSALLAAGMRLSAPLGEPITYKYVQSFGLTWDTSIDKKSHMDELLLAGVGVFEQVPGKGTRLVKGNTTYTKTNDDAYTEESVVTTWKYLVYDFRTFLEDTFTGTKGTPASISAIKDMGSAKLEDYRKAEAIVDTQDANGNPLHAWRDFTVTVNGDVAYINVAVTIVEGINFQLPTIYLTPVKISV